MRPEDILPDIAEVKSLLEENRKRLGHYVYLLRDPRDQKVMYVGEGQGTRLTDHVGEACSEGNSQSKHWRLRELGHSDTTLEWEIVCRGLATQKEAQIAEAAVMSALSSSPNGPVLNVQSGRHSATHGTVDADTLRSMSAKPVDPSDAYPCVFAFPVNNSASERANLYEAVRCCWKVTEHWQAQRPALAVAIQSGLCKGVFEIESWEDSGDKQKFSGRELAGHELADTRWTSVIEAAKGYWQRGNHLVVEFDGQGRFAVRRGSANKEFQSLGLEG